jgi:hypothetical protein
VCLNGVIDAPAWTLPYGFPASAAELIALVLYAGIRVRDFPPRGSGTSGSSAIADGRAIRR